MCVEFAYHSTSILAILDFQDSLDLSLDGDLLEMYMKLSFLAFLKHKYTTVTICLGHVLCLPVSSISEQQS